jgi:hypothetical protein
VLLAYPFPSGRAFSRSTRSDFPLRGSASRASSSARFVLLMSGGQTTPPDGISVILSLAIRSTGHETRQGIPSREPWNSSPHVPGTDEVQLFTGR